jgi:probable O-glycosylation ligase (exosortase A-associated)
MRDLIVSLALIAVMPTCFRKPFVGLLVFSLLAYMRLQDLTWGFAREVRWSFYLAIITFAGFFVSSRERRFLVYELRTVLMIALVGVVGLSLLKSRGADPSDLPGFVEFVKIVVIALFTTGLVTTRDRLRMMVWVVALSFAFYGFKNGLIGIASGGTAVILEGPGGMLRDNNDFALALGMSVPMLLMIAFSEKREILRRSLLACVPLTVITIGLTHSRGGFLALLAGVLVLVLRSRNKLAGITLLALFGLAGLVLAPQGLKDRLASIQNYEEDSSAAARFAAWRTAAVMIKENPVFGVGFGHFKDNYHRYDPANTDRSLRKTKGFVAHNSYLQIWAECGTPAFLIYLALIALTLVDLWTLRARAARRLASSWILNYATMFEASMATFVVGSVFLNRAHFDLFYHWVAIVLCFTTIARRELDEPIRIAPRDGGRGTLSEVAAAGFGRLRVPRGFGRRPATEGSF